MKKSPRITFGVIVLNGEPFTRYNLRSLYPFAHEIIIVEGASEMATAISTPDGHSVDNKQEDLENKLTIVTAEDNGHTNGFWPGEKDEQSQAYAERATGDYLWQIDIDEFYKSGDVMAICRLLRDKPSVDGMGFELLNFWGGFSTLVESWKVKDMERKWGGIRRIFRWGEGFNYATHRPPSVYDSDGKNLCDGNWLNGKDMAKLGIFCHHYGMVFQKQAREKTLYYSNMWQSHKDMKNWYENVFIKFNRPFHILHGTNQPSWIRRYTGEHPEQVTLLQRELEKTGKTFKQGNKEAIKQILSSDFYRSSCFLLNIVEPFVSCHFLIRNRLIIILRFIKTFIYCHLDN